MELYLATQGSVFEFKYFLSSSKMFEDDIYFLYYFLAKCLSGIVRFSRKARRGMLLIDDYFWCLDRKIAYSHWCIDGSECVNKRHT